MCAKPTLIDDLLEKASGSSPRSQAKRNIAQFLACKEEICDALGKGWNMRAIWELLYERRRFLGQYNCFTLYVRKFIRSPAPPPGIDGSNSDAPPSVHEGAPTQHIRQRAVPKPFTHNPVAPDLKSFT